MGVFIGMITFILGVLVIISPAFPPESICDIMTTNEAIGVGIVGAIMCISGIFNIVRT